MVASGRRVSLHPTRSEPASGQKTVPGSLSGPQYRAAPRRPSHLPRCAGRTETNESGRSAGHRPCNTGTSRRSHCSINDRGGGDEVTGCPDRAPPLSVGARTPRTPSWPRWLTARSCAGRPRRWRRPWACRSRLSVRVSRGCWRPRGSWPLLIAMAGSRSDESSAGPSSHLRASGRAVHTRILLVSAAGCLILSPRRPRKAIKMGAEMVTSVMHGQFREASDFRAEFPRLTT
jgi:hypothetical protein